MPRLTKDTVIPISLGFVFAALVAVAGGTWNLAQEVASWKDYLKEGYTIREAEAAWREAEKLNPAFNAPDLMAIRKRYAVQGAGGRDQESGKPLADVKAAN